MKNPKIYVLILVMTALLSSCTSNEKKTVVTKKIQYDVNIKSPDPSWDWWIQNIAGSDRETFVDMIVDGATTGKFQAYDYFGQPINANLVKSVFADTITMKLMRTVEPYDEYDTTIIQTINKQDILRVRFLEKWEINPDNLQMSKTIYGIAPIARRIDIRGIERWQPLFWIYTDKDFIANLNKN